MSAPIQTERFLLAGEPFRVGPRWRVRQRHDPGRDVPFPGRVRVVTEGAEQLCLSFVTIALMPHPVLARGVDRGQEPRPQDE